MAGYYVRRLIQQHKELLLQTTANAALPEGTLPEAEEILNRLATDPSERLQRINNLEILARAYQNLVEDGRHPEQLKAVEKQVLQLLGVSSFEGDKKTDQAAATPDALIRKEYTIAKVVEILQALLKCGEMYLGPKISRTYFVVSCPASLQLNGFSFKEDGQLKVSRAMTDLVQGQEIEDVKQWIKLYINRCSGIILGFDSLVNQEHLAYCSISRQEIQLAE
jgi:hypothetical protein